MTEEQIKSLERELSYWQQYLPDAKEIIAIKKEQLDKMKKESK